MKHRIIVMGDREAHSIEHARVVQAVRVARGFCPRGVEKPSIELAKAIFYKATCTQADYWFEIAMKDGAISENDFAEPEVIH
ncbi:hypothetical protein AD940_01160 [Gluconobacter thailandicus]|uniref:hypothetical protein n=1 Tax=Gluconobacter thailandicus TaxID=257438 RepID=UPI000777AF7F|nr:hypothetical protein [Gluconobacter thailandicus]KXV35910.1 hypothetical protein AD940_01160 [Gluconobacter thailandicus]